MTVAGNKFTGLTGGTAGCLDALDGAALTDGDIAIVMSGGYLYLFELDDDSGLTESSPDVIQPDANGGLKRWCLRRSPTTNNIPVGTIVAYMGGYFSNGSNGGFTAVVTNTAAGVNAQVNADGWNVCNGAALNDSSSPFFNGSGRYLPNITDDRFIKGDTAAGSIGGSGTIAHDHAITHTHTTGNFTLTTNEMPYHRHTQTAYNGGGAPTGEGSKPSTSYISATLASSSGSYTSYEGAGAAHNHGVTGAASVSSSGTSSVTAFEPIFVSCIYIMKTK